MKMEEIAAGSFQGRFNQAALAFCQETNLDGWIIPDLFDEFGGEAAAISYDETNLADIMLCRPKDCLQYISQKWDNLSHYFEKELMELNFGFRGIAHEILLAKRQDKRSQMIQEAYHLVRTIKNQIKRLEQKFKVNR